MAKDIIKYNSPYDDGEAFRIEDNSGTTSLYIDGVQVTATAAELNILDGVTATAAELNILDGVTATAAELNILDGVTSTAAELNILDGVTSTAAELNILDGVTSTASELNLLDGSTAANSVASVAPILDANKRLVTTSNVGTPGTNVTAVEYGDGINNTVVLTLSGVAATIGDNAALAGGALIYTFGAGTVAIHNIVIDAGMTLTTGTPTTDTPELGLGTVIGSGAVATLGDVGATSEDISAGPVVATNIAGAPAQLAASPSLMIDSAAAHTVHFNYADTWADVDDTAATIDGTVVINYTIIPA